MTKVMIISGFLGAGKTTLIMELLKKRCLQGKRSVIIENDFGEVEIDRSLLKDAAVDVENLKAGCICCDLKEHFEETLTQALLQKPEYILIEPSGVAHLSEVLEVVLKLENQGKLIFGKAISIVDAKRYHEYLRSYRSLLQDQITYADLILLSHTEGMSAEELEEIRDFLKKTNGEAVISAKNWEEIPGSMLMHGLRGIQTFLLDLHLETSPEIGFLRSGDRCGRKRHSSLFGHSRLKVVTVNCPDIYAETDLEESFKRVIADSVQPVIRAKGIVQTEKGSVLLQYVKDELKIEPVSVEGHCICFIGSDLDENSIKKIFHSR
ncbi:MAG: GTP-binding protein [Eubacteriales bacterium]|nr:GTP-binding protein [Eubacteriales bacterium]